MAREPQLPQHRESQHQERDRARTIGHSRPGEPHPTKHPIDRRRNEESPDRRRRHEGRKECQVVSNGRFGHADGAKRTANGGQNAMFCGFVSERSTPAWNARRCVVSALKLALTSLRLDCQALHASHRRYATPATLIGVWSASTRDRKPTPTSPTMAHNASPTSDPNCTASANRKPPRTP